MQAVRVRLAHLSFIPEGSVSSESVMTIEWKKVKVRDLVDGDVIKFDAEEGGCEAVAGRWDASGLVEWPLIDWDTDGQEAMFHQGKGKTFDYFLKLVDSKRPFPRDVAEIVNQDDCDVWRMVR